MTDNEFDSELSSEGEHVPEETAAPKQKRSPRKKGLAGVIVAIIAIALLIALIIIDGSKSKKAEAEQPVPAGSAESSESLSVTPAFDLDYAATYAKYAPDTVVYTVNGEDVTWGEYYCWIYSVLGQLSSYYGITSWTDPISDELTVEDYILEYAEGMSSQHALVESRARELGITLSAEDEAQVDAMLQEDADNYYGGDMDALLQYLTENYYTEEYYRFMSSTPLLYEKMFTRYYGEDGSSLSDEDAVAFLTDHDYLLAKHILLKTTDSSNAPLDDETVAAKKAQAEDLLAQLKAVPAEELEAKFDELAKQYSEDPGSLSKPDGYYFQPGTMVEPFETAVLALSDGEMSDIVESTFGYHIIYRPAMSAEDLFDYDESGNAVNVRRAAANGLFNTMIGDWAQTMEVVYAPEFENLDLDVLFDAA